MLRITRLAADADRYYLADLAAELDVAEEIGTRARWGARGAPGGREPGGPQAGRGRSAGRWHGVVAAGLGLSGPVVPADLGTMLSGAHPTSGRSLCARPTAVRGFDLTFSAPKSASVLFGMSEAERAAAVLAAHRTAVDAALRYVDERALSVRRGTGDGRHVEPARGVVAAVFTHGVSRALDPHLHSHVVVANLTHGIDGRWTALDGRGLFAHARAIGALYDAELRYRLGTGLGASWGRRRLGTHELDVVDPVLIGALSERRAEIRAHLHEHAPARRGTTGPSRRARAVAWAATRDPKPEAPTPDAWRAGWERRARDAGWSGRIECERERARSGPGGAMPPRAVVDESVFAASVAAGGPGTVTRRDVVAAWASALDAGAPARTVGQCVDALAEWEAAVGVAEARHSCRAVVPTPHVLRALGPRPSAPDELAHWLRGAAAIESYRGRWSPTGSRELLGVRGSASELSAMPARRLADHLALTRELTEIRRQLGVDLDHEVGRAPRGIERSLGLG